MARALMHYSGAIYHAMLRGNRKQPIFHDAEDRMRFGRLVSKALDKHSARCHAYCWMSNHVHLLLQVGGSPLSAVIHYIASCYAHQFNRKYDFVGHLFQGKYPYEHVADDAYLTTVARYIHMNPVKAGIAAHPADYPWSSFAEYFGHGSAGFVTTRLVLSTYDMPPSQARAAFHRFHDLHDTYEPGWIRADEESDVPVREDASSRPLTTLDGLLSDASERFQHPIAEITGPGRQRDLVRARAWIAGQARLTGCASLSEVARRLNRTPQAISQLVARPGES